MAMQIIFGLVTLIAMGYIAYLLVFKCRPGELMEVATYKEQPGRNYPALSIQKPVTALPKPKKRVTAIRTGMFQGLYDKGLFVDSLDKSGNYIVQELCTASDLDFYTEGFFETESEFKEAHSYSKSVQTLDTMICEELR
jgi:hypothetical protein